MTSKLKKTKGRNLRRRKGPDRVGDLRASVEDDLLQLAEEKRGQEARWGHPSKRWISLFVDVEVLDWFKSKGPGYQTRINRILRRVMLEAKNGEGETS